MNGSVPVFRSLLIREALELYARGWSCRTVAADLARRYDPAPSQQWVYERVRDAGVVRSKSRAMELREARRHGKNYDRLRREARRLAVEGHLSIREISRRLGVSRNMVQRTVPELKTSRREATIRRCWFADLPDVKRRQERRELVVRLRREGKKYREISAATGLCWATIYLYLRAAGLVRPIEKEKR